MPAGCSKSTMPAGSSKSHQTSTLQSSKRDRQELSESSFEVDDFPVTSTKQAAKKSKPQESTLHQYNLTTNSKSENMDVIKELRLIQKALANVVTKDDLAKEVKPLVTQKEMTEMKNEITKKTRDLFDKFELRVFELEKKNDNLTHELKSAKETTEKQSEDVRRLERFAYANDKKLNDLEQYGRANSIRVTGISDVQDETVEESVEKIVKLCTDELELDINSTDIDIAHRLGRYDEDRSRTIICKFISRRVRDRVIKHRSKLVGKKMFISEDMTMRNNNIIYVAKKKTEVENAWMQQGKILVKVRNEGIKRIFTEDDLHDI